MTTISRELGVPRSAKTKLRAMAAADKVTLGAKLADLVTSYAETGLTSAEALVDITDVEDPGFRDDDVRARLDIEESVWEQARVRTIMDETTLSSVIRRATIAYTSDQG